MTAALPRNRRDRVPADADAASPTIRALGIDPGLTRTGWALVAADRGQYALLESGVIAPRSAAGSDDLPGRLADGYLRLVGVLDLTRPTVVAVEDLFTSPRFPKSALKMAHLRGVFCLAVAQAGIPMLALTATTVKQRLTGNGHASKEQVQRMVLQLCDVTAARVPSDLSDAIALAIAGLHQMSMASLAGRGRR
jgi:crossover junction endodeoxyribonuclease RuvC